MDTEIKEYEVVELEDNKEYFILDEIVIDNIKYVYLSLEEDPQSFKIRKVKIEGENEIFSGLDTSEEFDKAMMSFAKKHIGDLK